MKPPPLPLLPLILTLIFLLILAFTPAECKKEKKQHMSEHAKMEPDWYDDEHEEEDFLEDGGNETDWTQQGIRMSESQFSAYWPPRTGEGVRFEETEDGMKEWLKYRDKQMGKYKEYLETLNKTLKNLTEKHNLKDFNLDLDNMARRYPFCVTGDLPIMDLMQFEPSGPLDLNTLTTIDLTLKEKDGLTDKDKVDPDLQEFKTLFLESQARKVVVATPPGISTIEHIENGKDEGPYIRSIKFTKLISPPPPLGIQFSGADGSVELPFWMHLIFKSRVPLQGLFVQAIGFPMGLPFGQFRDDFDCDAGSFSDLKWPVNEYNPDRNITLSQNAARRNIIVPCKYSHGNNNGDMHPNVYAYGGQKEKLPERTEFRMHFNWASVHCNLKTRVQFLIMAVRHFKKKDYDVFFSSNYILTQHNAAGSPPPYIPGSAADFGWDGSMMCDKGVASATEGHNEVAMNHDATSLFPIPYDGEYDKCIDHDETLNNFFADNAAFVKETLEAAKKESFNEPNLTSNDTDRYINNLILIRKAQMICPPADLCLNSEGKSIAYDINGHPVDPQKEIEDEFNKVKNDHFPTCQIEFCKNPNQTEPILVRNRLEEGEELDINSPLLRDGGTRFSDNFTQQYYKKATRHFRRIKGTHLWSMTLAWFVLMTIGAFTARYYKETAGINDKTGNSMLGLGYWIWVHIFLLLLSLTFMWIGILETARFRQKPVSCNLLGLYGEYNLKNFCRWRKRTVRSHRKAGIGAVVFYHIALAISWSRPVKLLTVPFTKYKFPIRKFFLWVHVVFAYLGKLVCFISILLLFHPRARAICKSIPSTLVFMEVVSIAFFSAGWVIQSMEDQRLRKNGRRVFPVPEAIESADHSPCYMIKIIIVLVSVAVHLILFIFICVLAYFVYGKPGKTNESDTTFETIDGIIGKCQISNSQAELDSSMSAYYFRKTAAASDG